MNTRSFLMLELLQRLDARLRVARTPVEAARLRVRKRNLRERLARAMTASALQMA
ncbi:hypothetical protein HNO88_002866 [Novosphingobium chloroacetimidivorans]|uniref:Uncharacterized protein n=1 Tax=Novosphingobium chloroacetimidivorans TaxID=1428314 RepID=A0A7W7NXW3_9SPHN|nr:DUF465 domain-containing protein [Novosphingobium chloroacetimidivorans]MBB4859537.1 hypothetical protein [Novosphingobium chloroacetimidivorans]